MILIGTLGLGPVSYVVRDVVGWLMVAQAIPNALQAITGRLHRAGEEMLLVNIGFMAFAAYQVLVTSNAPQFVATAGTVLLITSAAIATTLLWGKLSGRRLGVQIRKARESQGGEHP
jgi:hypothetical protein